MELRCENGILFGVVEGDAVEVKCRSRRCGAWPGVVVLHRFNLHTGKVTTKRYRDAERALEQMRGGNLNGTHDNPYPVRAAAGDGRPVGGRH